VVEQAAKQTNKQPIRTRPADQLKPEWQELRTASNALAGSNGSDEDVLTFAMFPQVAPRFFGTRDQGPKNLGKDPNAQPAAAPAAAPAANGNGKQTPTTPVSYDVKLNGRTHKVTVTQA